VAGKVLQHEGEALARSAATRLAGVAVRHAARHPQRPPSSAGDLRSVLRVDERPHLDRALQLALSEGWLADLRPDPSRPRARCAICLAPRVHASAGAASLDPGVRVNASHACAASSVNGRGAEVGVE
jgi:hypothetical protein